MQPAGFRYHERFFAQPPGIETAMKADEICFLPAHELVRRIRARELSALEVMDAHLEQTERVNPAVNAIVTYLARTGTQRRKSGGCSACPWR